MISFRGSHPAPCIAASSSRVSFPSSIMFLISASLNGVLSVTCISLRRTARSGVLVLPADLRNRLGFLRFREDGAPVPEHHQGFRASVAFATGTLWRNFFHGK